MVLMSASSRDWGVPPWRHWTPKPQPELPISPDTVIIGGGLTGVSTAYHLARRGFRPILLEASQVGSGASGRTGGIVLEGISSGPREGAGDCVPQLRRLVEKLEIDCDLTTPGCWEIVHRDRDESTRLPLRDNDSPIEVLRTVPGGAVEPGALTAGLADAAASLGAIICENCRVEQIILQPLSLRAANRKISPQFLVVAGNAWLPALFPEFDQIHSALTYACITAPLDENTLRALGMSERIPFYTADMPYLWARVCSDNSTVFGAGLTFGTPVELENTSMIDNEPVEVLGRLERRVRALHPVLANVRITSRWAGPIAFREGAVPLLTRHPDNNKVLLAGAYAGHGVAFSVHAGRLMAAAIAENAPLPSWGRL
jgi:gamma-glutamylputrescine oxidase